MSQSMRESIANTTQGEIFAQETKAPEKSKSKKNIEINLEKIIQIHKLLQSANECNQSLSWPKGRLSPAEIAVQFELQNDSKMLEIIRCCEEWWNIIREPTVTEQLNKCIAILSTKAIRANLQKTLIFQLLFFSMSGFLMSCQQYQFLDHLKEIAYKSLQNFLMLAQIIVDKFPAKTVERNAWAKQLESLIQSDPNFLDHLTSIEDQVMANSPSRLAASHASASTVQSGLPGSVNSALSILAPRQQSLREAKSQFLRMNNNSIQENLQFIVSKAIQQQDIDEALGHPLFQEASSILDMVTKEEVGLIESVDLVGKALRDDFDEPTVESGRHSVVSQTGGGEAGSGEYAEFEHRQDELSKQLRVQIDQGLKLVPAPYLARSEHQSEYTLVLDLDETLLHFEELNENEGQLSIRPGADSFLKLLSQHFELVIFTAGTEEYADWALSFMDNSSYISHRLYRQHALPFNGYYVKDLSRMGRDLSKTLIVDNIAENFQLQPNNGIFIKTWISDSQDTCLFDLAPLLLKIVKEQIPDVRELIGSMQGDALLHKIAYGGENSELDIVDQAEQRHNGATGSGGAIDAISSQAEEEELQIDDEDHPQLDVLEGLELGLGCQAPADFLRYQRDNKNDSNGSLYTPQQESFESDPLADYAELSAPRQQHTDPKSNENDRQLYNDNTIEDHYEKHAGVSTIVEAQNEAGSSLDNASSRISDIRSRKELMLPIVIQTPSRKNSAALISPQSHQVSDESPRIPNSVPFMQFLDPAQLKSKSEQVSKMDMLQLREQVLSPTPELTDCANSPAVVHQPKESLKILLKEE